MKFFPKYHSSILIISMTLMLITLGCGSDPVQPTLTEAEQKLTSSPWQGVWQTGQALYVIQLLSEEINFKADKSALMKICDSMATVTWKITDSVGSSFLNLANTRYSIEKFTADSLLLRDISSGLPYLMMRNFKVYNNVRFKRAFDNGTHGGEVGLPCAPLDLPEIPEMEFRDAAIFPNPCINSCTIQLGIGIPGTSVKITLDDGISTIPIFENILHTGQSSVTANLIKQPTGMYRLSYTVKTPDAPAAKTVHAYLFISK